LITICILEENMHVCNNVSEENQLFAADAPGVTPDEVISLRELLALVHPLCRNEEGTTIPDIAEDIIAPAQQCDDDAQRELEQLCTVFSLVLDHLGGAILSGLAEYLAIYESAHTLKRFLRSVKELSDTLSASYETSILDAFARTLTRELIDEPF
jgi:hypothetical protein